MTAILFEKFQGILLDAYGVFWGGNGVGLYPSAKETMENLVKGGKTVGILSNSTQAAQKEIDKVAKSGLVLGKHFHFFITSGEIARDILQNEKLEFATPNKKYWLFGEPHPRYSSLNLSPYERAERIEEADFIYVSIPHINGEDVAEISHFDAAVRELLPSKLPMLCANPDLFAHEGNPPRKVVRQGSIAKLYEQLGGKVSYIGKPSQQAYMHAMKEFAKYSIYNQMDVLMVGDTPETDIRGANRFGMPSCLLTKTGIMAERIEELGKSAAFSTLEPQDLPQHMLENLSY